MSSKQVLASFSVNVTFLPPDSTDWRVPDDSSPFMCFDLERELERYDGSKTNVATCCKDILTQWVTKFKAALAKTEVRVHLWLDDARTLCEETLPEDLKFDFIDTSNLADTVGLISLLVYCQDRLKENNGVLRTEVFDWWLCMVPGEHYLRRCADIPPLMYPTVLGLHLAEELEIGHERYLEEGIFEGRDRLELRWKKAAPFTPCTLTGKDIVTSCISSLKTQTQRQLVDSFKNVKSAHLDDMSQHKALDRLKKVTREESSLDSGRGKLKVVEHNDRYEIEIQTGGDFQGELTVRHDGDGRRVKGQVSTGRTTIFSAILQFSCPVLMDGKTLKWNNGLIQGTLFKDRGLSVGERVLPWRQLTSKQISNLPDYPQTTYSDTLLKRHIYWVFATEDGCFAVDTKEPYPTHQLKDLFNFLMVEATEGNVKALCIPRKNPNENKPLDKYQSTIKIEGLKLWENKATIFLTLYKHDIIKKNIREGRMSIFDFIMDFENSAETHELNEILLEGYEILTNIMHVNSYHRQQETDTNSCSWKIKSFLRMRYPFKTGRAFALETKTLAKFTEAGEWKDQNAAVECERAVMENLTLSEQDEIRKLVADSQDFLKPACDSCGRLSDCKTCTGCNRARYCSRQCQKKAWPQHKLHCSK